MIQGSTKRYICPELQTLYKSIPSLFPNNVYKYFITTVNTLSRFKLIKSHSSFIFIQ